MDLTSALPTFLITLREGVEAALVVGIVLACLKKAEQSQLNPWVYGGIAVGIVASALVGILFSWGMASLTASYPQYEEVIEDSLEGGFSLVAIALLSWMLVWMTQQARTMKAEVAGAVKTAIEQDNAGWGIFTLILIAVLREGFEAVSLVLAYFQSGLVPAVGAIAGVVMAAIIGLAIFKLGVKINIRAFFQVMGVLLLLIVAGLVISALAHLDVVVSQLAQMNSQAGLCFYGDLATNSSCVLGPMVWDASSILPQKQFPGILLKILFGYREQMYTVEAVGYLLFLVTVGGLYLNSLTGRPKIAPSNAKSVESSN
ncbi:MAG: FTR1 family iron permease [Hormoscilla sp. GM7CHS1pb]|nr:FTR1 family iron permease [Hormoscilla sp. GM7CHS1pb]